MTKKTTKRKSVLLEPVSAPPKKSPLQTILRPIHHSRRVESGDGLSTWAMKRMGTRSGQPRFESPKIPPPVVDGCKDSDQNDQLVDDAMIFATWRLGRSRV